MAAGTAHPGMRVKRAGNGCACMPQFGKAIMSLFPTGQGDIKEEGIWAEVNMPATHPRGLHTRQRDAQWQEAGSMHPTVVA